MQGCVDNIGVLSDLGRPLQAPAIDFLLGSMRPKTVNLDRRRCSAFFGRLAMTAALLCTILLGLTSATEASAASAEARKLRGSRPTQLVADVNLDRRGAVWPPRLTAAERADIMLPEAMKSGNGRRLQVLQLSLSAGIGI